MDIERITLRADKQRFGARSLVTLLVTFALLYLITGPLIGYSSVHVTGMAAWSIVLLALVVSLVLDERKWDLELSAESVSGPGGPLGFFRPQRVTIPLPELSLDSLPTTESMRWTNLEMYCSPLCMRGNDGSVIWLPTSFFSFQELTDFIGFVQDQRKAT